jgi:hypothetical protein
MLLLLLLLLLFLFCVCEVVAVVVAVVFDADSCLAGCCLVVLVEEEAKAAAKEGFEAVSLARAASLRAWALSLAAVFGWLEGRKRGEDFFNLFF